MASEDGDGVCLDGKRLIFKQAPGMGVPQRFESEIEDFSEIFYSDQSDSFTVTTKSGERRYYGQTDTSRIRLAMESEDGICSKSECGEQNVTAVWALDRVEDAWGNFYELQYTGASPGTDRGESLLPETIAYTGHRDSSTGEESDGPFEVSFSYESRAGDDPDSALDDTGVMRFRDSVVVSTKRLKGISIKRRGEQDSVASYSLSYWRPLTSGTDSGPRSRLERIYYCTKNARNQTACAGSVFGWGTDSGDTSVVAWSADQADYHLPVDRVGAGTQFVDIDGDGLVDLVQAVRGYGVSHAWRNTGTRWEPKDEWKLPAFVALGEPKVPIGDDNLWENQAWRMMKCVVPGTDPPQMYPEGVSTCRSDSILAGCCSGHDACHPDASCVDDNLKAMVDPDSDDLPDLIPSGTVFADLNGDGLPDLITDHDPDPDGKKPKDVRPAVYLNRIRETKGAKVWERQDGLSGENLNQLLLQISTTANKELNLQPRRPEDIGFDRYSLSDIDGDGRAELVFVNGGISHSCAYWPIIVLRANFAQGRWDRDTGDGWKVYVGGSSAALTLADVNRDGLPDIVDIDGTLWGINTGNPEKGDDGSRWRGKHVDDTCFPISMPTGPRKFLMANGDLDGDGIYDQVVMTWKTLANGNIEPVPPPGSTDFTKATKVFLGTGAGWGDDYYASGLLDSLWRFAYWGEVVGKGIDGRRLMVSSRHYQFADLNADGRADAVVNADFGGIFLQNNGSTLVDLDGHKSWEQITSWKPEMRPVPSILPPSRIKAAEPFDTFMDLNGDGITDRIQVFRKDTDYDSSIVHKGAWLNKYRKPVILHFPNGHASGTTVAYVTTTTAEGKATYSDSGEVPAKGTRLMPTPMNVVQSVYADDGIGGTKATSYRYKDLRATSVGKGPAGFAEIEATDESSGITTTTSYAQAYPYTGMPTKVVRRDRHNVRIGETETVYCDSPPAPLFGRSCYPDGWLPITPGQTGIFVYPWKVKDTSLLRNTGEETSEGNEAIVTETEYAFDDHGNPTSTTVTTSSSTEKYVRTVTNDYGTASSETAIHGKPASTVVTSTRLLPPERDGSTPTLQHKTQFEYTPEMAVSQKMVEHGTGFGTEVRTAYHHDNFGNVDITTVCASDFEDCEAGRDNPNGNPEDPEHPPFRSTYVSFNVIDFTPGKTAPQQSLGYRDGMYPVRTKNALGHVQYTAYDDLLGVVVQSTGPNGIHSCFEYDPLGFKTAEVGRCNFEHLNELKTTFTRYSRDVPWSKSQAESVPDGVAAAADVIVLDPSRETLIVTEPPVGAASLVRMDSLERVVETITYDFQGKLVHVDTEYDHDGRISTLSKPHLSGVTGAQRSLTITHYDWLGRVESVSEDLGSLDGGSESTTAAITTTYSGASITTTQTVKGESRTRTEWKNVLGKISKVKDAEDNEISYSYDPDGNLIDTKDHPAENTVHIEYDVLGRKVLTRDPDLGTWTYGYNGFGDLIWQKDSKNQETRLSTKMTYDQLGRMRTKTDPAGKTSEWVYDLGAKAIGKLFAAISVANDRLAGDCVVPGTTEPKTGRAVRLMTYNNFGDLAQSRECIAGETYVTNYGYDSYGRQNMVTYPQVNGSRFAVESVYSSLGFLHYLADGTDEKRTPYWVALEMNPAGQVIREQTRNGVELVSNRNAKGWLLGSRATALARGGEVIQELGFTFDEVGSLRTRKRGQTQVVPEFDETFAYDKLDRLRTAEIRIPSAAAYSETESFVIDRLGNITQKGGKTYSYSGCHAGPHAVCSVGGGAMYVYDANGNMTSGNGRSVEYDSSNKPAHIRNDTTGATVDFAYGADGQRVLQDVGTTDGTPSRTVYIGLGNTGKSIYERTTTGSKVEHVHFLYAGGVHGGNAIALRVETDGQSAPAMKYNLFDHLGSVTAMADEYGRVIGPASDPANATVSWFDAWGARRNPDGSRTASPTNLQPGHREYTGHETIPDVGLVNMNGRVYDPDLGRFLTPDPTVQFVANLQSYNRYAYVLNNPLRYTDPTGYGIFESVLGFVVNTGFALGGAAACAVGGPAVCIGVTIMLTMNSATAMASEGASFNQIVKAQAVGFGAGLIGGAIGGMAVSGGGGGLGLQILVDGHQDPQEGGHGQVGGAWPQKWQSPGQGVVTPAQGLAGEQGG